MYSKDRQSPITCNPNCNHRNNDTEDSNRNQEGNIYTAPFASKASFFPDTPVNNNRHHHHHAHTPASNAARNDRKQDHIVQNFYAKVAQIVIQSRTNHELVAKGTSQKYFPYTLTEKETIPKRINRWFNLIMADIDGLRDDLKFWRHQIVKVNDRAAYPMIIDIFLDISKLPEDTALMHTNSRGIHRPINTVGANGCKIQSILLESWVLQLKTTASSHTVDLPNLYKKSIVFFRSLHSLVRLLPAFQVRERFRESDSGLALSYRLRKNHVERFDEISYDTPLTRSSTTDSDTFDFADMLTPIGALNLCVHYRRDCSIHAKSVVRDIATLETAIDDWQPSRQTRKGFAKAEDLEWPLMPFAPPISTQRYSSSPASSLSSSFSTEESSTATSFSYRRPSTPLMSPFKSKSLSSSFGAGPPQMKSNDSDSHGEPTIHRNFSSNFERYYNNRANREDDDSVSMSGRRGSKTSLMSIDASQNTPAALYSGDDDLSEFMGIMEGRPDLKMFRSSSLKSLSPGEERREQDLYPESGSIGKSKAALSRFQDMKSSHTSLSESLSSSNTSSRPLSTVQSTTDNNLTSSLSSMSSFHSKDLSSSGASNKVALENKSHAAGRNDVKRVTYSNVQIKSATLDETIVHHPESYGRTRRMQISPPLVDRHSYKQSRPPNRQIPQNAASVASSRGQQRLATNNGFHVEPLYHYATIVDDEDTLIFAMNDMEHN